MTVMSASSRSRRPTTYLRDGDQTPLQGDHQRMHRPELPGSDPDEPGCRESNGEVGPSDRGSPTRGRATRHDLATHRELEEALAVELGHLTLAQRGALELKSLGYSLVEIAEALGTTSSNAGVLVHRARKVLAVQLARFLETRPDE